jgi:putative SOS response-associated peptidase YedK
MCGRYASTRSAADLAALFDAVDESDEALVADYNIAPTDPAPIVRRSSRVTERVLSVARWGLVPAWARDASGAARMINARAETVATSSAFSRSFAQRRCLVPVDGWYEWVRPSRQPYFMTRADGLALGGLWSTWGSDASRRLTFSIVTLPADGDLALVHNRMPLVLAPELWEDWLTGADPAGLLRPPPREYAAGIELRPVSAAVGDVRNDGPELIRPVIAPSLAPSSVEPEDLTLF